MILYPAIDLKKGKWSLIQGKMNKETVFNHDPLLQAKSFVDQGCEWLHLIDLDGALSQSLVNQTIIKKSSIMFNSIQLGGGIRNFKTIEHLISVGVQRIILGTIALSDPQLVKKACKHFPNKEL